jgi:hypothetical protein
MKKIFKALMAIVFMLGVNSLFAQSPNSSSYKDADQVAVLNFINNIDNNINVLNAQKIDWSNQTAVFAANDQANKDYATRTNAKYIPADNSIQALDKRLASIPKTSVFYNLLIRVNSAIQNMNTENSLISFSQALLLIRETNDYSILTAEQKKQFDTYLCTLDNVADYCVKAVSFQTSSPSRGPNFEFIESNNMKLPGWLKCTLGILGGGILGGLSGAGAGTLTLPVIETVGGGVLGTIGGAIAGASQSC